MSPCTFRLVSPARLTVAEEEKSLFEVTAPPTLFPQLLHQGAAESRLLRGGHRREGGAGGGGRRLEDVHRAEAVGGGPSPAEGQVQGRRSHRVQLRPGEGGP